MSKPKIYHRRRSLRTFLKIVAIVLALLLLLAVVLFFVLKQFAVYHEDGTVTIEIGAVIVSDRWYRGIMRL